VHVEGAQRLPVLHAETSDLFRALWQFRWRLGLGRVLLFALRGAIASAVTFAVLSLVAWATGEEINSWLAVLPFLGAIVFGLARWPSTRQAALAADRRLGLDERLATAVEVTRRPAGRFDSLLVRDAVDWAHSTRATQLWVDERIRRESLLCAAVVALALLSLLLRGAPTPRALVPDATTAPIDADLPGELSDRALPVDVPADTAPESTQPISQAQTDAGLPARVRQEQAEQAALDKLSQALNSVSAAQPAANAIQQGDFASARSDLQNLGDNADQLSDAAKRQLAKALQDAAAASATTDRQLADRERQAAQALSRPTYADQRQALRGLADQVERSGARAVSSDQLAREVGQLQQQTGAGRSQAAQAGLPGTSSPPGQLGQQPGRTSTGQASGASGQQGGPGIGSGANSDVISDQQSRLDTSGQNVQVPTKLGNGPGVRPSDGTEDQTGADPSMGGQSVSQLAQSQQTGQVAPEQNLVPGEQRPVVRGYFR
jgi:hypothetical protein